MAPSSQGNEPPPNPGRFNVSVAVALCSKKDPRFTNQKAHLSLVVDENHPVVAKNRYLRDRLDELRGRLNGNPGGCP